MPNKQETMEERFRNKFPNKIAEVIDDFGSSIKSDIADFIHQEKALSFKEGSAHLGEEKRKAYQLGFKEGQEEEAIRHQKEDLKGYAEGRASMAEEVRKAIKIYSGIRTNEEAINTCTDILNIINQLEKE